MAFTHRRARGFLLAGMLAIAISTAGQGQAPPSPPQAQEPQTDPTQPTFRVEASFVLTDVFVTADGTPVTDLRQEDFEVHEDGVLQTIRSFEHVQLGGVPSGVSRRSPSTVAESRAAAADPRRRVFVLFLDTFHITRAASMETRESLKTFLRHVLGPDDLIALYVPQMAGGDISFSTTPDSILAYFENTPVWGVKDELPGAESDAEERELSTCFIRDPQDWLYLRSRMREERSLKALRDLVQHLSGLRESRKAIIAVTEGWRLFIDNQTRATDPNNPERAPGIQAIGVGPDGRLGTPERYRLGGVSQYTCDTLRQQLAGAETRFLFETIIAEANRNNASFYTVDAQRLRTEMRPIATTPLESAVEMRNRDRTPYSTTLDSIKRLGLATNGLAIADSNDLDSGLRRVAEDFNSYYLLGYNSTNSAQDGRYRRIKVAVKRPGVQVRAREGYRAARPGEVPGAAPPPPPTDAAASQVSAALSRLGAARPGVPFLIYASAGLAGPDTSPGRIVRVVAELSPAVARSAAWVEGGEVQAVVRGLTGETIASAEGRIEPGSRTAQVDLPVTPAMNGEIKVHVRLTGSGPMARHTDTTTVRLEDDAARLWGAPVVLRRGPTTGTAWIPTADMRFRRQERVRVQLEPGPDGTPVAGALLDRNGQPLEIPVRVEQPADSTLVAELILAPLAAGDYVMALRGGDARLLVPFRIVP